jgi:hypothetical protein
MKTYNTMANFWKVCILIEKSTVLKIFIKWNIFYQLHYFNVFDAFSKGKTILLCIMLQNYLLSFMYGERLYALQEKQNIHLWRINSESLSECGTNSSSPTWNDVYQQEFCTRY